MFRSVTFCGLSWMALSLALALPEGLMLKPL